MDFQVDMAERAQAFKFQFAALHGGDQPTQDEFVKEIDVLGILDISREAFERWRDGMKEDILKRVEAAQKMTEKETAERFLVVVYDLADGRTDKTVNGEAARLHANRLGIRMMTDDEFKAYRKRVTDRVKNLREEASGQPS